MSNNQPKAAGDRLGFKEYFGTTVMNLTDALGAALMTS